MENFRSEFRGEIRSEAGPWLLTMTLMDLCGVPEAAATSYNNIPGKVFSGIPGAGEEAEYFFFVAAA